MNILIIEDEQLHATRMLEVFEAFEPNDNKVTVSGNLKHAINVLTKLWPDLVILDALFPPDESQHWQPPFSAGKFLDCMKEICEGKGLECPNVILVSGQDEPAKNFDVIEKWLKEGRINDVLPKNIANVGWTFFQAVLAHKAKELLRLRRTHYIVNDVENVLNELRGHGIITRDKKMIDIWEKTVVRSAESEKGVVILGETGTGKGQVAKAIHKRSLRSSKAYIAVSCGAFTKDLIESELFGHEKGAFANAYMRHKGVFERADGGTLFLDEVGELPLAAQVKLLRALREGEIQRVGGEQTIKVNVRVITATHRNLEEMVQVGEFRQDLYQRINVIPIRLPPLRERINDIQVLTRHFLDEFNRTKPKDRARP